MGELAECTVLRFYSPLTPLLGYLEFLETGASSRLQEGFCYIVANGV